jgi:elongation factor Tu-like protein
VAPTLVAAGHQGHGKTTLIEALGLAPRPLDQHGPRFHLIDRDRHDQLVLAMLEARPLTIDAYLLVVAADEGITTQTREHVALLRALGVGSGLTVVTKTDLADPAHVLHEITDLVPGTHAHATSLRTRAGLDALRLAFAELAARIAPPGDPPAARFAPDGPPPETRVIDAALDFGPRREREPQHGVAAIVHLRGARSSARLARLGGRFWQLRLDRPLAAAAGDRLVIRQPGAADGLADAGHTLGGGIVLDPAARRHPTSNEVIVRLTRIWRGQPPLPPEPARRS